MIFIIVILLIFVVMLHIEIMEINREYLCDTSSLKLRLTEKEKEIVELKRQVEYHKNKLRYEDYLKD
jgi:predicted Holliday junction resolvase-like endonuclease